MSPAAFPAIPIRLPLLYAFAERLTARLAERLTARLAARLTARLAARLTARLANRALERASLVETAGVLATIAFLVVFRVLIKDFF